MKDYNVLSPIKTAEGIVREGILPFSDKDAAELIAAGAIEEVIDTTPTDPEVRHAKICEAIGMLDPSNEELWTRSGKPDISALVEISGWTISAAERDAAWAEVKPAA